MDREMKPQNDLIPDGVWPTMITPYTEADCVDYSALERLIEWYHQKDVDGLFAVCGSSEMFCLSLEERVKIAEFVKSRSRIPVIASGHVSASPEDQVEEILAIADTGVDAVVLVTNRLVSPNGSDDVWRGNVETLLNRIPNLPLGFYECPAPYKRLISPELMKWCASTGRFFFFKDTSCDLSQIRKKWDAAKGSPMKLYNANAATLYESLQLGIAGYCGVMANFHPELYRWGIDNLKSADTRELFDFLSVASLIERQCYPINAKMFIQLDGVDIRLFSRVIDESVFSAAERLEVEQLYRLTRIYSERFSR
jgi:4-hydroxy-tetrahydrodipicolinate synthase